MTTIEGHIGALWLIVMIQGFCITGLAIWLWIQAKTGKNGKEANNG